MGEPMLATEARGNLAATQSERHGGPKGPGHQPRAKTTRRNNITDARRLNQGMRTSPRNYCLRLPGHSRHDGGSEDCREEGGRNATKQKKDEETGPRGRGGGVGVDPPGKSMDTFFASSRGPWVQVGSETLSGQVGPASFSWMFGSR